MFKPKSGDKAGGGDNGKNKDVTVPLVHTEDGKGFDAKSKSHSGLASDDSNEDNELSEKAIQAQESKRRKRQILKVAVYFMFGIILIGVFTIWLFHKDPVEHIRFGSNFVFTVKLRSMEVRNYEGDAVIYAELGRQLLASPYDHCWDSSFKDYEENCLYWRKMARLRIAQHKNASESSCYTVKWEGLLAGFNAEDCFYLEFYHWYGRLTENTCAWPITDLHLPYVDYYPAYPKSQTDNLIPVWFGAQSVSVFINSKYPFRVSWNTTDKRQFCIKSINSASENGKPADLLEYTVCQGNTIPDIYTVTQKNRLQSNPDLSSITTENSEQLILQRPIYELSTSEEDEISNFISKLSKNGSGSACSFLEVSEGWEKELGDLAINPNLTDRISKLITKAVSHNCHPSFPISPFFSYKSQHFQDGVQHGYFVKDSLKLATRMVIWRNQEGAVLDVTDQKAIDWFLSLLRNLISKYHIKALKLLHVDVPLDSTFIDGNTTYLEYNQIFYNRLSSALRVSFVLEMSSSYIASPVYTPVKMSFQGNVQGSTVLNTSVPNSLILGMSGFPLLIAELDTASMHQNITLEEGMMMRWLQLAIFYPVLRIPNNQFTQRSSLKMAEFLTTMLNLRQEQFVPYLREVWAQQTNMPIIRPLWWSANDDRHALTVNDQFMVGDNLLVAPMLSEKDMERSVYLPEGTWVGNEERPVHGPRTILKKLTDFNELIYYWKQD